MAAFPRALVARNRHLAPHSGASLPSDWFRTKTGASSVGTSKNVQLREVPRVLLFLRTHSAHKARRRAVGKAFRSRVSRSQAEVHARARWRKICDATKEGRDLRQSLPIFRYG